MAIPPLINGLLPLGRHPATTTEIDSEFVRASRFAGSSTRAQVWTDFQSAHRSLDSVLPVLAAWIGGSFTTGKLDPDDVDVLWIIDGRRYPLLTTLQQQVLELFSRGPLLRARTGARVDSYVFPWEPIPRPAPYVDPAHRRLAVTRGYWDDWWLRQPQSPRTAPPTAADTIPRRGYVEVTFRDYLRP